MITAVDIIWDRDKPSLSRVFFDSQNSASFYEKQSELRKLLIEQMAEILFPKVDTELCELPRGLTAK